MTIRERLSTIGQGLLGNKSTVEVKEIIKEVQAAEKSITGGFLDFSSKGLSSTTRVSSKLLEANTGWVYRNNDVIAKEVATIEFELFTVRVVGGEVIYEPVLQNPLLDLLDRFNEFTSSNDGFYITQSHRKLAGDCFWYLDGDAPNIRSIFILPPDKITIRLGKEAGSMRVIEAYDYKDTIEGKTVNITYKPENIIHFKVPNPKNFYRGLSAVEAAADAIDTDTYAIEANRKLFERGLISNFLLTTEKSLTPEQLKKLRAEFRSEYSGVGNAFQVPILSGGLKPETVQMSNKDLEFIRQQEWVRDKIAAIFGNNKAILGVTDDVNRANADATIMHWKRTTVRSDMKDICDTLNEFLVPHYGTNLILGFKDPVGEDEATTIDRVVKKKNAGIINLNEAREELSYDEVEGGHMFEMPMEPTVMPKSIRYVKTKAFFRKSGIYEQLNQYKIAKANALPLAEKIVKDRKKKENVNEPDGGISREVAMSYYKKQIKLVEITEQIFKDKVEKFIEGIVEKALSRVPTEVEDMQSKALIDEEDLIVQAGIDFTPLLTGIGMESGDKALELISWDKPYKATDLKQNVEKRVNLFATSMVKTDKDKLTSIISNGITNGDSVTQIRNSITETFDGYSKMQAERIARTEVLEASNMAAVEAWKETGLVQGKQWLTANPCPICAPYYYHIAYGNFCIER